MEQSELDLLTTYLNKVFNQTGLVVLSHPEDDEKALVADGQSLFGRIDRDEDEGELCYNFSKNIPDQPDDEMREHFREIFNGGAVELKKRANKQDSAEIYKGEEFLGVLYDDDGNEDGMQIFNMAILDIDLEDV